LPASGLSAGCHTAWHAYDQAADQAAEYGTPALFQSFTKPIPSLLSCAKVVALQVELVHVFLEMLPKVLNGVEIW
jgi:hypothetical protein